MMKIYAPLTQAEKIRVLVLVLVTLVFGIAVYSEGEKTIESYNSFNVAGVNHVAKDIIVTQVADGQIVRNVKEGYEIKIPLGWGVPNVKLGEEKIVVVENGLNQKIDTELQDGVYLQVYIKDNPKNLTIMSWAKKYWSYPAEKLLTLNVGKFEVIKTVEKMIFGRDEKNPIIINDSMVINISFSNQNKIYTYSCTARGKNYLEYSKNCEEVIRKNIIDL